MSEATESTGADESAALKSKLAALREARAKREEASAAETPDKLREQIAAEELAATDANAIAAAESKHGKLGVGIAYCRTRMGVVIVKRAASPTYRKFQDLADPKMQDIEALVRPLVVYPALDRFDAILLELPGVLGKCAKLVGALAGGAAEEVTGKS